MVGGSHVGEKAGLKFFDASHPLPQLVISTNTNLDDVILPLKHYITFITDQLPENPSRVMHQEYFNFIEEWMIDIAKVKGTKNERFEELMSDLMTHLMFRVYQLTVIKTTLNSQHLSHGGAEAVEICSICQEDCTYKTMCSHSFHEECLNDWIRIRNTCPICRRRDPKGDSQFDPLARHHLIIDGPGRAADGVPRRPTFDRFPATSLIGGLLALSMILQTIYTIDLNIRRPDMWQSDIRNIIRDMQPGRDTLMSTPALLTAFLFDLARSYM